MSRLTFAAFIMLSGFFYVTGKPVDKTDLKINSLAETPRQTILLKSGGQPLSSPCCSHGRTQSD